MEFLDIGKQCSLCKQHDYLPFLCDCCHKYYCLDHRDYESHHCPNANLKRIQAVICPQCDEVLKISGGYSFSAQVRDHFDNECTHHKKEKVKKCPVPGCNKKLYSIDKIKCNLCGEYFCTEHRFPDLHNCPSINNQKPSKSIQQSQKNASLFMSIIKNTPLTDKPINIPNHPNTSQSRNIPTTKVTSQSRDTKKYICKYCSQVFTNNQDYQEHMYEEEATCKCPIM
ncbi:hypothetical protein WA158_005348 [Blastocystis sp. Blastoise]